MKEYIEREKAKEVIAAYCAPIKNYIQAMALDELLTQIDVLPAADVVSKGLYEQIKWERDLAIEQLKEYGVSLGEKADVVKVVRCKDCIHWGCYGGEYAHKGECKMCESEGCWYEDDYCSYGERMNKEE